MRHRGTTSTIALIAAVVLSGTATAATNPVIDWTGPMSAAFEPNFVAPFTSVATNELKVVGTITLDFKAPLAALNPSVGNGGGEYTFVFDQLISLGTVDEGVTQRTGYSGGRWRVFQDAGTVASLGTTPPNATSPGNYEDGSVILSGTFTNFYTRSNELNPGGNYNADVLVTGGSAYDLMQTDNALCGYLIGVWNRTAAPAGYIRTCDAKLDFFGCPVAVEETTWSRIKGLLEQ